MKAVLMVGHGSRNPGSNQAFEALAAKVKELSGAELFETVSLEFSTKTVAEALNSLAGQGALNIEVLPCLLFPGHHFKNDLTGALAAFTQSHPHISIRLHQPLGEDEGLAALLASRLTTRRI